MEDAIALSKTHSLGNSSRTNAVIESSWKRCYDLGLNRSDQPRAAVIHDQELRMLREESHGLWQLARRELRELYSQVAGANYVVAFADRSGTILESLHDQEFATSSASQVVIPGSVWNEEIRGTNALGLTLTTQQASVVDGNEHFLSRFENISCFASPVRNTQNEIVGIIDASTDARSRGRHTLALVKLAATNLENSLFKAEFDGALILGFHPRPEYLNTTSAGLLAISEEGFIIGASGNAKEMLRGFDLRSPTSFESVFDARFSSLLQKVLSKGVTTLRDRMRSTVHCSITEIGHLMGYINKIHVQNFSPVPNLRPRSRVTPKDPNAREGLGHHCRDPQLTSDLKSLARSLANGGSMLCCGPTGSGKTTSCKQLLTDICAEAPFVEIDCGLLSEQNYETLLFGNSGRLGFFEPDHFNATSEPPYQNAMAQVFSGKIHKSAKGMLYLRNFDKMPEQMAADLLRVLRAIENPSNTADDHIMLLPKVLVLSTTLSSEELSGKKDAQLQGLISEITDELRIPDVNDRLDINQIIRSVVAETDPSRIVTIEAERLLSNHYWKSGIRSLQKTIRQIVRHSDDRYIRQAHIEPLLGKRDDELQPCPKCLNSAIKREKCLKIRATWKESHGNISVVSRKLGLSRTTIYAHLNPVLPDNTN